MTARPWRCASVARDDTGISARPLSEEVSGPSEFRFAVRLDGAEIGQHQTYERALASAQDLKRAIHEQLVTVWDLPEHKGIIIEF